MKPFRIGPWTATPDDSGERDGWWLSKEEGNSLLFVKASDVIRLRRLIERVEASEAKRRGKRAATHNGKAGTR